MKKNIYLLIFQLFCGITNAQQPGSLDLSFDNDGKVKTATGNFNQTSQTVIQPDGKIIVGTKFSITTYPPFGTPYTTSYLQFRRYSQNGLLDNSFGTSGISTLALGIGFSGEGVLSKIVLQTDGKIVAVGGSISSRGLIVRLNANGTPDTSFDGDGIKEISLISGISINAFEDVAIQSNNKIVAMGSATTLSNRDFAIIRINSDGTLDLSFDEDGLQTTDFGNTFENAKALVIQSDGKIVVAGNGSGNGFFYLARYTSTGVLDNSFDTDGKQTILIPSSSVPNISSVLLQPDGKIIIVGDVAVTTAQYDITVIRLLANGSLDPSFNPTAASGYVIINLSTSDFAHGAVLQNDNKIVVICEQSNSSTLQISVLRLNPDGTLDNTFDNDGKVIVPFGTASERAGAIVLQNDGKIIISGYDGSDLLIARLHGVSNFNSNNGKMITQIGNSNDVANAVAVRPDGKIITAGYATNAVGVSSNNDFALIGYNADGSLDYTFGNNAIVKTDIATNSDDQIKAITILADGKILVVGESISGTNKNIVIAKYLADGSGLDPSFGVSGMRIVTFAASPFNIYINAMAVHSTGLIFVGGAIVNGTNTDFMLARFTSTGSYIGYTTTNIVTGFNSGYALAIQPDNKVVFAGSSGGNFAVVRYNINATLDNTFGTNGKVITSYGTTGSFEEARSVALQADGKILVGGNTDIVGGSDDFAVMRFNPNGSLDNTFGSGGKTLVDINAGSSDLSSTMVVYPSGKIVVAGQANFGTIGICRFNNNGTLDTGFDGDGKMTLEIGYNLDQVKAMALLTDGKMILSGNYLNGSNNDFALLRVNGINDFSVNNGRMTASLGLYDNQVSSMLVQTDGKIILAGQTSSSAAVGSSFDSSFGLMRFNTDGSLDNTFDGDGKVKTSILDIDDGCSALALQSDGKIIAAGTSSTGTSYVFSIARYNTNGSLDALFGTGGKKTTALGTTYDAINSLAIQPADGKIIAAGYIIAGNNDCAMFRYNSDGSTDNTFGTSGKVITAVSSLTPDLINSIALQNDGKIVAVGRVKVGSFFKILVLRYTTAGVLDNTFDGDGILQITTSAQNDYGKEVEIQADGKIVIGGYTFNGTDNDFVIIRLNTDGTFDNTFNGTGRNIIPIGTGNDLLNYLKILPNGKILATGSAFNTSTSDVAIVRLNTNGGLDGSFDSDGKYTTPIGSQGDRALGVASINNVVYVGGDYNANTNYDFFLQKLPLCAIETPVLVNSADNYPNIALPNPVIGKSITATNFISNPANVTYQVKEKIDFLPGFKAENVQLFKTEIATCNY
jgi:uncharacterized delta-60 repeat protein